MEKAFIRRRRRSTVISKRRVLSTLFVLGAVLFIAALNISLTAPVIAAAKESVTRAAVNAMNDAVYETAAELGGSFDLLSTRKTGEETFIINADTAVLSLITSTVIRKADEKLASMGIKCAEVDLGTATGSALLSGRGPVVEVGFTPLGSVSGKTVSSLKSSGINQCLFSLELSLAVRLRVLAAGRDEEITVLSSVPIAEAVVVGKTPQVYTNVANEEDMLNLIPTGAE